MYGPPSLNLQTTQAYRHLYRALLHAVQFSKPARYVVRDQIRNAFRRGKPQDLNQLRIARTLEFLNGAARETGLEHKILKNLVHTAWAKEDCLNRILPVSKRTPKFTAIRDSAHMPYQMTIAMLNDQMGLCIPID